MHQISKDSLQKTVSCEARMSSCIGYTGLGRASNSLRRHRNACRVQDYLIERMAFSMNWRMDEALESEAVVVRWFFAGAHRYLGSAISCSWRAHRPHREPNSFSISLHVGGHNTSLTFLDRNRWDTPHGKHYICKEKFPR